MSYLDGLSAFNLEMPDKIPRTEYSAHTHWELIKAQTGIDVGFESGKELQSKATEAFVKAWDYGYVWNTYIHIHHLNKCRTSMGHANFAAGGTDFNNKVFCPFDDPEDCLEFDPMAVYGKIDHSKVVQELNENYAERMARFPDAVNTTGSYITLVSGLIEIFGWDMMLMAMGIDAKQFGEIAKRYANWILQYMEAIADSDAPIVTIHDDIVWTSGAFADPAWYREFVFPQYKKLFAPIKEAGKKIIYTSDGNFTEFIDDIADCGVNGFVMEPMTDMAYIAEKYGKTHSFVGNADTRILLYGSKEDIYNEVKRCVDIGKNCPGFFMAVGNHIPSNTPVENALYYNEVFEKLRKR